jgi:hypothetical protein
MASENKKRKAKNSYLHNGADKEDGKLKREMYYTKRERQKDKKIKSYVKSSKFFLLKN